MGSFQACYALKGERYILEVEFILVTIFCSECMSFIQHKGLYLSAYFYRNTKLLSHSNVIVTPYILGYRQFR